jgi:uncharacterized protein YcbX
MQVGTLVGLWRYPVKSMAAEALTEAEVGWHGITGDRRWAFIRPHLERSGFPWLTLREVADIGQFTARLAEPAEPDRSKTRVTTPEDDEYDVTDPALATASRRGGARHQAGSRGVRQPAAVADHHEHRRRDREADRTLARAARFRPNLLVAPSTETSFPEDAWLGATLTIGGMRMRVDRRDPRCVITTMDPDTGERDARVLREIAQRRDNCAGVYGTTVTPGPVALGDAVVIEQLAQP